MKRIFVTSLGVISCLGDSVEQFWEGICTPEGYKPDRIKLPMELPQNIDRRIARRMDRFSYMTLSVSMRAMDNHHTLRDGFNEMRTGTVFNSAYGPLNSNLSFCRELEADGVDAVSPILFTSTVFNVGVGHTCLNMNLKGASTILMGSNGIAYACDLLRSDKADTIFCGGIEEYCQALHDSYQQKDYTTKDTEYLCRPLDAHRSGTRMLEGAGVLILENESAFNGSFDGAICEVMGYSSLISNDYPAKDSETMSSELFADAMRTAIEHASIQAEEIDGILMSSGGGRYTDRAEAQAVHEVFGTRASSIPVAAIKGAIGETMGASFTFNAIAAALVLDKGIMPVTAGCEEPDPQLELNIVHGEPLPGHYRYVLVNGYDVSGGLYSVILGSIRR